jgi:hypothetical protein
MQEANQLIKDYVRTQQRVEYVDVATPMFYGQEKPPRDLFVGDGLHPTAKCYALWTSIVRPVLMRRFGAKAASELGLGGALPRPNGLATLPEVIAR